MGSKNRIAKHILPIILKNRKEGQCYVEPFVGGANMIDKVDGWRIGADFNVNAIQALEEIRDNIDFLPKTRNDFTEDDYKRRKALSKEYSTHDISFAGFAYSYGGKWFGGWRRDKEGKRDYIAEAYRNALKQSPYLQGVLLKQSDFIDLEIPENSIIYCDIPYKNTTKYSNEFNYDLFYDWCRNKTKEGHQVFISEYNMPNDFKCLWSKEIVSSLTKDTGSKKATEKLFTVKEATIETKRIH